LLSKKEQYRQQLQFLLPKDNGKDKVITATRKFMDDNPGH
jgi:hypothetical protein